MYFCSPVFCAPEDGAVREDAPRRRRGERDGDKKMGKFAYGEVELEEGTRLNAVVRGISKKNREELTAKLPLNIHASIIDRDGGFKTVIFDLDDEYLN